MDCDNLEPALTSEPTSFVPTSFVPTSFVPTSFEPILEEILEFEPNSDDLLISEINIPEKINIDSSDVLPSLEEMVKDNFTQFEVSEPVTSKDLSAEEMQEVMSNIESTVNFTNVAESMHALNNPEILLNRIQNAFNTFKEKTGRTMTYSEMRYMMG
jgi:hypothetical protein